MSDEQEAKVFELLAVLISNKSEPRSVGELTSMITPILAGTPRQQQLCREAAYTVFKADDKAQGPETPPDTTGVVGKSVLSRLLANSRVFWLYGTIAALLLAIWVAISLVPVEPETSIRGERLAPTVRLGELQNLDWIHEIKIEELEPPQQSWSNRTWRWFYTEYDFKKWVAALGPWLVYATGFAAIIWAMLAHLQREKARRNIAELPYTFRGDRPSFGDRKLTSDMQPLRRVPWTTVPEFDALRSVNATVRAAGSPKALFRNRIIPVEFVTLVDRRAPRDHFAAFGTVFFESLINSGIGVESYHFNQAPAVLTNARTGLSERTEAVLERLPGSVILVFMTEDEFFDPITGRVKPSVAALATYGDTYLFLPESQALLSPIQANCPQDITILPASSAGLRQLVELVSGNGRSKVELSDALHPLDALFARLSERRGRWMQSTPIPTEDREALIADLRSSAGPVGMQWLAATAVYPDLRWPMTLRLRDRLGQTSGRPARLDADLLRVVQLPWYRFGRMPRWLRDRLIQELPVSVTERVRAVLFEAIGYAGRNKSDNRSLGIVREVDRQNTERRNRADRLMLKFLLAGQYLPKGAFTIPRELARRMSRRPIRNTAIAGVIGACLASVGSYASLASLPIHKCDLWGSSPWATDIVGPGVGSLRMVRGGYYEKVIEACSVARETDPGNDRFDYQYVRALTSRQKLTDEEKALSKTILDRLVSKDYPPALNSLAVHHSVQTSLGLPRDHQKAIDLRWRAYHAGSIEALSSLGFNYANLSSDNPENLKRYREVLEKHYAEGGAKVFRHAYSYREGKYGYPENLRKYVEIVLEGVRRRDGESIGALGYLYETGQIGCDAIGDCEPDHKRANYYYHLAVEISGETSAASNLANQYNYGRAGVAADRTKAFYWAVFSARQGNANAGRTIVELVAKADDEELTEWGVDRARVVAQLERFANSEKSEDVRSQFLLGHYFESLGEIDRAMPFYHLAAEQGYQPAVDALGRLEN